MNTMRQWITLLESHGSLTPQQAALAIAQDDHLFKLISDYAQDQKSMGAADAALIFAILKRITPTRLDHPLYRGEDQTKRTSRGFHSWSDDPGFAHVFADIAHANHGTGVILVTRTVQGFEFNECVRYRRQLRPESSLKPSYEREWLLLDPSPDRVKVITDLNDFARRHRLR